MKLIIELEDVSLRRGEQLILDRINWMVERGSCAAILGHNGSGKSTIARIVACHLWPTSGKVAVLGETFGEANLPELRHRIRLVQPAGPYDIDPSLTAREVVLTGFFGTLNLYDRVSEEQIAAAEEQLGRLGMSKFAGHTYATLSSGEKVRSLIARALVTKPELLLLDEPTAGLDLLAREQVLATVQRLAGQLTILMITHHVEELLPATSNVLLLRQGRVVARGSMEEVLTNENLSAAYDCAVQVRKSAGRFYAEVSPEAWKEIV
ncbi:MAG TPA: ATP-binding cassette domain-containing protein [Tepidisphaeraceae bacterium]|jgi:iron complex transport system ATP-binding protein